MGIRTAFLFLAMAVVATTVSPASARSIGVLPKKYYCSNSTQTCEMLPRTAGATEGLNLDVCLLICENNLWPLPSGEVVIEKKTSPIGSLRFKVRSVRSRLLQTFVRNFKKAVKLSQRKGDKVKVVFEINSTSEKLSLETDELYTLDRANDVIKITSETLFGARHGLETLSQMVVSGELPLSFHVTDKPAFPYRGVMIDVSRNFIPENILLNIVRGLGQNKLNSLHLHLSDTASFPVEIPSLINVTRYGAYSEDKVYTKEFLNDFRLFALEYGVNVIAEIDLPAHAAAGYEFGPEAGLGNLTLCTNTPWTETALEPPPGTFNPVNDKVHTEVLSNIFSDVIDYFGDASIFHLGGDEVPIAEDGTYPNCWNSTEYAPEIMEYLEANGFDRSDDSFLELWKNFTIKSRDNVERLFTEKGKTLDKLMQWVGQSELSLVEHEVLKGNQTTFPKELFMFEAWDSYKASEGLMLVKEGYEVILANYDLFYLDCGGQGWVTNASYWCPEVGWYDMYDSIPKVFAEWNISSDMFNENVRGAEITLWTEMYDAQNIQQRLWPRGAAHAERLWTNPNTTWFQATARFHSQRYRMVDRGIPASALQPLWCAQNGEDKCTIQI